MHEKERETCTKTKVQDVRYLLHILHTYMGNTHPLAQYSHTHTRSFVPSPTNKALMVYAQSMHNFYLTSLQSTCTPTTIHTHTHAFVNTLARIGRNAHTAPSKTLSMASRFRSPNLATCPRSIKTFQSNPDNLNFLGPVSPTNIS